MGSSDARPLALADVRRLGRLLPHGVEGVAVVNEYAPLTWEPKLCAECGKRVSRRSAFYCFNVGDEPYALHHDCAPAHHDKKAAA